jgi:tRNA-specific adenosine deaminase 1
MMYQWKLTMSPGPARRDAPPTVCKSCTDKLSLAQCTSLLRTPASLLVHPSNAYVTALVVPKSEFHETGFKRAFSDEGRMKELKDRKWEGGYAFRPFTVLTTEVPFEFSEGAKPGNVGVVWCAGSTGCLGGEVERGLNESIIGAVKQGAAVQKVIDPENREPGKGASGVCRRRMWGLGREVVDLLGDDDGGGDGVEGLREAFEVETYEDLKGSKAAEGRRRAKRDVEDVLAPKGWVRNSGDEMWGLDMAVL